ncbi:16857_t:CDS:2 [Funneliformis mosseae]|uniref:16857_t:CDS:1 n=1 Tax=Funneliformis mosseae TaxID=27381 RepID=A0A9N9E003_FUNMO|nr:16857_t:CDS:2 [Funneliformis mosseae]
MQTLTRLNSYDFIITVLGPDLEISPDPRYQANCYFVNNELINEDICISSSVAITSLYKHLFGTKTKFSGIRLSENQEWNYAGDGYQSSFIDKVNKKQFLYIQSFATKKCILTVYEDNELRSIICGKTPADVWSHIDHKPEFDANKLFGIDNKYTQALISKLQIPSCTPEE